MSRTVDDSSLSLQTQVSDRTFTVGIQPAQDFLVGVMVLSNLPSPAAMTVKKGEIHLSATNPPDFSASGTFHMLYASAAASWTSSSFALSFDPSNWTTLLAASMERQNMESFWIYKIAGSPDLYCLVGDDSEPIKLGEAKFVDEGVIDLRFLPTHKVRIILNRECFRDVLMNLAPKFHHAAMMVKRDSISWYNLSAELIHNQENGDCIIDGVEQGEISYLLIDWREPRFLMFATCLAMDVHILYLVDPDWMDWSLFVFMVSETTSLWCMFRGSDSSLLFGL